MNLHDRKFQFFILHWHLLPEVQSTINKWCCFVGLASNRGRAIAYEPMITLQHFVRRHRRDVYLQWAFWCVIFHVTTACLYRNIYLKRLLFSVYHYLPHIDHTLTIVNVMYSKHNEKTTPDITDWLRVKYGVVFFYTVLLGNTQKVGRLSKLW